MRVPSLLNSTAIAAVTCFAAIHNDSACSAAEPIVLGAVYNLSGSQAGLDVPSSRGAQLAVDQFNRNGGLQGQDVQLVIQDGKSEQEEVRSQTTDLFDRWPMTTAVLGLSDTDMVLAAAPVAAKRGRVFLTSGATSPRLPAEVPEYLFLACFGDNVQASAAAEWAYGERSARTAAVFFEPSVTYTRLLRGYFETRFEQLGGRVTFRRGVTRDDLREAIDAVPKTDIVFLALQAPQDIARAIELLRDKGVSAPIVGGDSFDVEQFWKSHADIGNVYFTTHAYLGEDNQDPRVVAFRDAYLRAYPESTPDAFAALGYDATRLLLSAIEQAPDSTPEEVRQALAGIREFVGVTGTMSYAGGSRIPKKSVTIIELDRGSYRLVGQFVPAKVPPP